MRSPKAFVLLRVVVVVVSCCSLNSCAQQSALEMYVQSGKEAYQQGQYAEAEKLFSRALREADKFAPTDPRLAAILHKLARVYTAQGKYSEALSLQTRALKIIEFLRWFQHCCLSRLNRCIMKPDATTCKGSKYKRWHIRYKTAIFLKAA